MLNERNSSQNFWSARAQLYMNFPTPPLEPSAASLNALRLASHQLKP